MKEYKKKEKKQKKILINTSKYYEIDPSDIIDNNILFKRKRGRPKKSDQINNNIMTNIMVV